MRFYLRLSISDLPLPKLFDQLFKAQQNWLSKSNCQEHEKYCVNSQATDIEDLLFDFEKRDQLVIVDQHAEGAVNPTHHSRLSRLSLHPSQLNNVEDILSDEDTD